MSKDEFISRLTEKLSALRLELSKQIAGLRTVGRTDSSSSVDHTSMDQADFTTLIQTLIDKSLDTYSADRLARPDYALFSAGARIIPDLTSATYTLQSRGMGQRFFGAVFGSTPARGRPPVTALHPDTNPGMCWSFAGSSGQLGVMLHHPVYVSDITIEHVSRALVPTISTAPKDIRIYGVIHDSSDLSKIRSSTRHASSPKAPAENFLLLATLRYDAESDRSIQTYPVDPLISDLAIPVQTIVAYIDNNWGNDDVTCLYRLRVHGST